MASLAEVGSRALTLLGERAIASIDPRTEQGRLLGELFPSVRRTELTVNRWVFSLRRAKLARVNETPAFGWLYTYPRPPGCLVLIGVGLDEDDDYQLEGDKILADATSPLPVRYVVDVEDAGLWPAMFVEVMAAKLAREMCLRITERAGLIPSLDDNYFRLVRSARHAAAIEQPAQSIMASEPWVEARR